MLCSLTFSASEFNWLVSEEDAPQSLLPLPKNIHDNDGAFTQELTTSLRGTQDWAPPRPQLIFTLHRTES